MVWAELILFIERWLKIIVGGLTGYTPVEMMLREPKSHIFEDNFSKSSDHTPSEERLEDKLFRAYVKMKRKALDRLRRRKAGLTNWESKLHIHPIPDALQRVTAKFIPTYSGP